MKLPIDKIRMDGDTQPRAEIDMDAVTDYAGQMAEGVKFPPVDVFHDGTDHWLAHGFHRTHGAKKAGHEEITCIVQQGTVEEARWFSFSMNQTNGMRRTSGDKARAIRAALQHPKAAGMPNTAIAKHVGCHERWVRKIRDDYASSDKSEDSPTRTVTRAGKTYEMDTSNIGGDTKSKPEVLTMKPAAGVNGKRGPRPETAKKQIINGLSVIHGVCIAIPQIPIDKLVSVCTQEEIDDWSEMALSLSRALRKVYTSLKGIRI